MKLTEPLVAIVAGSKSDEELIDEASSTLSELGIPHEKRIISAHRTPNRAMEFASTAKARGLKAIIAIAGKAAHLAGVLASKTIIPVIGVPAKTSDLGGMDSLLSTVQMPSGIPVATVAIGKTGAKNAALLAAQILALSDESLSQRYESFRMGLSEKVEQDDREFSES
ncbi:MAG: 5-(carboxyamino)imidazole ribonucleotide mutase [Candidatus Coatesbacteria bacterium]|nr:5-(carboxyamino)imidazole ribonucleotide mutase [Candidatus Coatesbacteria bacterium]